MSTDDLSCWNDRLLMLTKDTKWVDALTVSLCAAIVLSIVVVTGYGTARSLSMRWQVSCVGCRTT